MTRGRWARELRRGLSTSPGAVITDPFQQLTVELCSSAKQRKPVSIQYDHLMDKSVDLSGVIERAFGALGLGIITVSGVPGLGRKRRELLPLSYKFANLPDDVKARYVHRDSAYSFGWSRLVLGVDVLDSHGVENPEGVPDLAKGSYYANPIHDQPVDDPRLIKEFAPFVHPNIWPKEDLPELEIAFKAMGQLMVEVGAQLAWHCDTYVQRLCPTYPKRRLSTIIRESKYHKGRLLHYFPMKPEDAEKQASFSDWCGFHNDNGVLTALVTPMYFDLTGREVACPSGAGLYVASRKSGQVVQCLISNDLLAFQLGETAQILSGGLLRATPHAVRGTREAGISRGTFAVFTQPAHDEVLEVPASRRPDQVYSRNFWPGSIDYMKHAPTIQSRWSNGTTFAEFAKKSYYA